MSLFVCHLVVTRGALRRGVTRTTTTVRSARACARRRCNVRVPLCARVRRVSLSLSLCPLNRFVSTSASASASLCWSCGVFAQGASLLRWALSATSSPCTSTPTASPVSQFFVAHLVDYHLPLSIQLVSVVPLSASPIVPLSLFLTLRALPGALKWIRLSCAAGVC